MGDGADAIHLPPAGVVADDHAPVRFDAQVAEPEPLRNQRNYRITEADKFGVGSLKQKCRNNLAAIELLLAAETEGKAVPPDERPVLVRYVGWGGLPQVFDAHNEEWKTERERLEAMLTPDELNSARATTLNAHYTSPTIILAMYAALERLGFEHGRILEPACVASATSSASCPTRCTVTRRSRASRLIPSPRTGQGALSRCGHPPSAVRGSEAGEWLFRRGDLEHPVR